MLNCLLLAESGSCDRQQKYNVPSSLVAVHVPGGTYCSYFSHHDPPHNNDTASDGVHIPFSSLDTPPVFLTVISLPVYYIKPTALSFRILSIVAHCLLACVMSCLLLNKMNE